MASGLTSKQNTARMRSLLMQDQTDSNPTQIGEIEAHQIEEIKDSTYDQNRKSSASGGNFMAKYLAGSSGSGTGTTNLNQNPNIFAQYLNKDSSESALPMNTRSDILGTIEVQEHNLQEMPKTITIDSMH